MVIKDSVEIAAAPETVWRFIEDPENLPRWNPKVKKVQRISHGAPDTGFRYRVAFVMGGREREMEAEITEFGPPRHLVTRMRERIASDAGAWRRYAEEQFELTEGGRGTRLTQTVRLHHAGVSLLLRALISFLMRFGKPSGQRYLERLRDCIEKPELPI